MGHCLSCLRNEANTDDNTSYKRKDEVTEITVTNQLLPAPVADFHQERSHLHQNENANDNFQLSDKSPVPPAKAFKDYGEHFVDSISITKPQTNIEKPSKPFFQKLPSIPNSISLGLNEHRVSDTKINQLFDQYKDSLEDAILAEGIENLCNDLQLNPDDFKVLVLAWKLNASQMCRFTKTEFTEGLKDMKTDTIKGIQQKLTEITSDLSCNTEQFKDLYRFSFKFGLDVNSGQRILPADIAIVLWRLVFTYNEPPLLERWLTYLENNTHIRGIPKDTWYMFLNFCDFVGSDLSNYDDTEAWPSLFDDFVEYENDQMNQNISKSDIKVLE